MRIVTIILLLASFISFSQEKKELESDIYLFVGGGYSDYGANISAGYRQHIGAMKEFSRHVSLGADLSYYNDDFLDISFSDLITGGTIDYEYNITQIRLSPRLQYSPIRPSEKFRFFVNANPVFSYLDEDLYEGELIFRDTNNDGIFDERENNIKDVGDNEFRLGYDVGLGFHFKPLDRLVLIAQGGAMGDFAKRDHSSVSLSIGYNFF